MATADGVTVTVGNGVMTVTVANGMSEGEAGNAEAVDGTMNAVAGVTGDTMAIAADVVTN